MKEYNDKIDGYICTLSENINSKCIRIYKKKDFIEDVSICIQGRYHEDTLIKNILNASKYGNVILSVWGTNGLNEQEVRTYIRCKNIPNGQNVYLQVYSSLQGLRKSKTKYTIKIRGDEYYDKLNKMIEKMKNDHNKIITSNIFFRKISYKPYHISDHIIGGITENMLKMFEMCKKRLDNKNSFSILNPNCPEQWLTASYMINYYKESELNISNAKYHMIKHFDIVRLEEFGDFTISFHGKTLNEMKQLYKYNIINITDIIQI